MIKNIKILLLIGFILIPYSLFSSGSKDLIHRAEDAWEKGDYKESALLYRQLSERESSLSESALYNRALSLYKQNDFDSAEKILSGLSSEKSMILSGSNSYKKSESLISESGNSEAALAEIKKSISWFERVSRINSENRKAAHNLEIAKMLKKNIETVQDNEQKQQQKNQEMENQLEKLKNEQEKLADDSQKGAEDHQKQQQELNKQTEDLKNQMENGDREVQNEMNKAREMQDKALEEMETGQYAKASESQEKASEALNSALDFLNGEDSSSNETEENSESENQKESIAQSIIENENKRESSKITTGGILDVDRNW